MPSTPQSSRTRRRGQPLKRSYVACIPCRTRKVKCIIELEPPCAKCEREHRECRFDIHEKSWKHRETPKWAAKSAERNNVLSEHAAADQPRQQSLPSYVSTSSYTTTSSTVTHHESSPNPRVPISTLHATPSGHIPDGTAVSPVGASSASPSFTDRVVSSIVTGPRDALDILFDAANTHQEANVQFSGFHSTLPQLDLTSHPISVISQLSLPQDETLDLWDKCRFVRQGWFTAQEAVTYVDLFYQRFAPLSPVVGELYRDHSNHTILISEEPMLCCTILVIASRYFVLPGAGGHSRSHFIHQRLWQYCELLIRRVICGQEKYSTAKTRVLGTIESLLLISDWHPRTIHFPPETEGWDGLLVSPAYDRQHRIQQNGEAPLVRWREDVFEPSKRAERMSWMLIGCAVNLAYELGVFVEKSSTNAPGHADPYARSLRLRKLLYVYVTQIANRLGCGSILPDTCSSANFLTATLSSSGDSQEIYISLWISLTRLTKAASAMFFPSLEHTKQTVLNGQYAILLDHFSPSLEKWWDDFASRSENLTDALRLFLDVEYCYLRAYTNALSVQAVVEKALIRDIQTIVDCRNGSLKHCFLANDVTFIKVVLSAGHRILRNAIVLASKCILRYAPSRIATYITCSSVLLLKAVFVCRAAGVHVEGASWQDHLRTLESAIGALRSSAIDDMDLACRYATLIEKQIAKLHACFALEDGPEYTQSRSGNEAAPHGQPQTSQTLDYSLPDADSSSEELNEVGFDNTTDDSWWTLPFDPSLAPFTSSDHPPFTLGFQADSLDFLWNLTDIGLGG